MEDNLITKVNLYGIGCLQVSASISHCGQQKQHKKILTDMVVPITTLSQQTCLPISDCANEAVVHQVYCLNDSRRLFIC